MSMHFEDLESIRAVMLEEFNLEQASTHPYFSKLMTTAGRMAFPELMRQAILTGNEETLQSAIDKPMFWRTHQILTNGKARAINIDQAAHAFALNEFSTIYTRALCKVLQAEGIANCQVYRAAIPKWESADCASFEGMIVPVVALLEGHRARYHPEPGNPHAFSIPYSVGCHHSIRRV